MILNAITPAYQFFLSDYTINSEAIRGKTYFDTGHFPKGQMLVINTRLVYFYAEITEEHAEYLFSKIAGEMQKAKRQRRNYDREIDKWGEQLGEGDEWKQ